MFSYITYGLNIRSDIPLPELVSGKNKSKADAVIRLGKVSWVPDKELERPHEANADEIHLYYKGAGTFRVRGGCEIIVDPEPSADLNLVRVCILGPVLASLLHQRGLMILHASAVSMDGAAVIFLGGKGWGKSTLAAYLQGQQYSLVADDIVALTITETGVVKVLPGFPQVKLWPSSADFLGLEVAKMTQLQPDIDKLGHRINGDFSTTPLPLRHIYVLGLGDQIEIELLTQQASFIELMRHSYLARYLSATGAVSSYFQHYGKVVSSTPVYSLIRPRSLNLLPELANCLEKNLASLSFATTGGLSK